MNLSRLPCLLLSGLACACLLCPAASAQAQAFYVSANGYVSALAGSDGTNSTLLNTGRLQQGAYSFDLLQTASDDTPFGVPGTLVTFPRNEYASVRNAGGIDMGSVRLLGTATASENPTHFSYGGNSYYNPGTGQGITNMGASWGDTLTITSSLLAPNTPVQVRFTLSMDGSLGVLGDNEAAFHAQDSNSALTTAFLNTGLTNSITTAGGIQDGSAYDGNPDFPGGTYTIIGTGRVGQSFQISGGLGVFVDAHSSVNSPSVLSFVDDGFDAAAYVDLLTPGAFLVSASGHDYASPAVAAVPESTAMTLPAALLCGGALALWRARRRAAGSNRNRTAGR